MAVPSARYSELGGLWGLQTRPANVRTAVPTSLLLKYPASPFYTAGYQASLITAGRNSTLFVKRPKT